MSNSMSLFFSQQLSPTYCTTCLDPLTTAQCFTIPELDTHSLFEANCNIVYYIASTISIELDGIEAATQSWLDGRNVGPLPTITNQQWLDAHVHESSPAYGLGL